MKLNKMSWMIAASQQMAQFGVDAVKVERLARDLDVSKGSFYWHFKNRGELLDTLLTHWVEETDWLIVESEKAETPIGRLIYLFQLMDQLTQKTGGFSLDTAMFRWSLKAPHVADQVRQVEAKRIAFLTKILTDQGVGQTKAEEQANLTYLAFLGYEDRANRDTTLRGSDNFQNLGRLLIEQFTAAME